MKKDTKKLLFERMHKIGGMPLKEGEYFNEKLPDENKRGMNMFRGRGVTWYGFPDQMIVIKAEQVHGMWGNIYDNAKLSEVVNMINNSEENVEFECSYGLGNVVSFQEIVEHQESAKLDSFMTDYEEHDEPYSLGDEELDDYIGTEDVSDMTETIWYLDDVEIIEFINQYKMRLAMGDLNKEQLIQKYNEALGSEANDERNREDLKTLIELETRLNEAIRNEDGDLGKFTVQLRDGHHRVMGAIKAGEEYVCLNLAKDDIPRYSNYINRVTQKADV